MTSWTPQEKTDPSLPGQPPESISLLQGLPLHIAGSPWKGRLDSRWSSALVLIGRWPCSGGLQPHFPAPTLFSTRRPCLRDKLTSQLSSWACLLSRGGQGVLTNCLTWLTPWIDRDNGEWCSPKNIRLLLPEEPGVDPAPLPSSAIMS